MLRIMLINLVQKLNPKGIGQEAGKYKGGENMEIKQLEATNVLNKNEVKGILAICALNKLEKRREIRKRFKVGNLHITFHWQSSKSLWGRFGGGWQWALGFEASKRTLLLNCLVFSLMIWREHKKD